jgi:hypothetical protein
MLKNWKMKILSIKDIAVVKVVNNNKKGKKDGSERA